MKVITIFIFFCAFLLLRPYQLQQTGLRYGGDDESYFAHSSSLAFGQFSSYEKEYFTGKNRPLHSIGPGLMAAPFVFIFSLIDRVAGSDIVYQRTLENTSQSWSLFGFVFASSFYFWVACFLLYKGLRYYFQHRHASLVVILMVLCQGIPLFVFRRPIFSHIYEFFLQSLLVFVLLKTNKKDSFNSRGYWAAFGIGVVIGLMFLVRFNNVLAAFIWPLVLLGNNRFDVRKARFWKTISLTYAVSAVLIIGFKVLPDFLNPHQGYRVSGLLQVYLPSFYVKRIFHILFGIDWGLIYTAPFILIGLIALFRFQFPLKKQLLVCLAPMAVNFYIIIMWKTQGSWYGYRYLIASIIPLLVYPLAFLFQWCEEKYGKKISVVWGLIALVPLLSMLSFEGNSSNLTLAVFVNKFGKGGWGNNTYQIEVWKMLAFHPYELFIAIFKGGLLYIVYLGAEVLGAVRNMLPPIVYEKYPVFQLHITVKTFIIYALPFVLYWVVKKGRLLNQKEH